jgi:cobalt-zinc-cadmium resistance protein CzcA
MLTKILFAAIEYRWLVVGLSILLALLGGLSLANLNIDAFPDTTPVQVQVNTTAPALVATEIESLITFPIEQAMGGMPGLSNVRSISQFGLSQVTLTFQDGTDIYRARNFIQERLSSLEFPVGIPRPTLGPVATGLGEVLHYHVKSRNPSDSNLMELRTTQDWRIRRELKSVQGAAEINSWGGLEKQYQVLVDPDKLFKYKLTLQEVFAAVEDGNLNVGGGYIDRQGDMLLLHGIGRTKTPQQIENIVIKSSQGVPVSIKDVATVAIGHDIVRGMVTANGEGEVVLGLGFMRIGESSYRVTTALRKQLDDTMKHLPPHIEVKTVYDRTELVDKVITTVRTNLCEGALLVVVILYLFLGNLRAGLIAAVTIPLSMLFAFIGMWPAGIAGTLLSLGAIDFGIVVDSSVVMLENIIRRLAHYQTDSSDSRTRSQVIKDAANEVRIPTVFGQLIIMIVYIPILTLEGVEGKMFRPMALTVMLVLTGSLIFALTLTPALASLLLPAKVEEREVWLVRAAKNIYQPMLQKLLALRMTALGIGMIFLVCALGIAVKLGTEFVPQLSEGAIVIGVLRVPGTSLQQSAEMNLSMERFIRERYPEVQDVWSRIGEPEINTDAGSPESTDMFVTLKSVDQWRKQFKKQSDIVNSLSEDLKVFKGQTTWFTQPIEMRINEMLTGSRSDLSLKLFGSDVDTLIKKSGELEDVLQGVRGCTDLSIEQIAGQPILQVKLNQDELARYGISATTVLDLLQSVSGVRVSDVVEDQLRFPLVVRLPQSRRNSPDAIANLMVAAPTGEQLPLSLLASIEEVRGPKLISSEWGKRRIAIQCNVRGRDIGSFVAEAQQAIERKIILPDGFRIEWGGQFENMIRAQRRLMIVVPIALAMILALLFVTYRSMTDTLLVFASVPFACAGGIFGLWFREMPISISAAVGFITLSGVSVLNSMLVVSYLRSIQHELPSPSALIQQAWLTSLRTVMMTALVASVGFIPMAISMGSGAEVQRPLATVVISGVIASCGMTLLLLPALYSLFLSDPKKKTHQDVQRNFVTHSHN